jgi:hypothetical protein
MEEAVTSLNDAATIGRTNIMSKDNKIRKAWEAYFGTPIWDGVEEPFYPEVPCVFLRGFVDGYSQAKQDMKDGVIEVYKDEACNESKNEEE